MAIVNKFNVNREEVTLDVIYDVTANNTGVKFSSLSELLSSENLSNLIPTSVRHRGMSIRFIQSFDNKYVQYRLMTDEFTTDTTQWAIADESVYVENPEFIYVKTDKDNKILWAIKTDGSIYYGTGVPPQIIDYINKKIAELSLDEYVDIVAFINNLEKGDKTLQTLLNEKVDKEEGKSLINAEYASSQSAIENPEFIEVTTDSVDKIISCRKEDGTLVENVGIETSEVKLKGFNLSNKITEETSIYVEKPKFAELYLYGMLPTDVSDERTPTSLRVTYRDNHKTVFSAKCELSIQGHGTANSRKHNYTIDFKNENDEELAIKFGDMIAIDSFHLKGYHGDPTHSRGIGGMNFYRDMVKHLDPPYDKINNIPLNTDATQSIDCLSIADAKYGEDGFPLALYYNNVFYGLYTLKLKKHRKNYAMYKSNKTEIFLDCRSELASSSFKEPFNYESWELKNPKLKNYVEGGEIKDQDVLASINRLFDFLNNFETRYQDAEDYIVVQHWILWTIFHEIIGGWDTIPSGNLYNNIELLTWDNIHWSIIPYDLDSTVGLQRYGEVHLTDTGFIQTGDFMASFRNAFDTEFKQLYTKLRNIGVITLDNVYRHYVNQCKYIPRDIYEKDFKRWYFSAYDQGINIYPSIEMMYFYLKSRIDYLDTVWLIND